MNEGGGGSPWGTVQTHTSAGSPESCGGLYKSIQELHHDLSKHGSRLCTQSLVLTSSAEI
ncbi:hypothetical protein CHLRE_10g429702v5 [Chlamydomonas reinhardtii]|uniref:Uncharacterized protein n=1 Tax=Chlamydomonas reinhardtii TaxID=3055 RepID=A0A2K3D9S1_CHLRE|nr:uncharacterized protein CHLRE_10g429702v5 [Chlamydomonas reinhardtii]PNW77281.1 hypothetical protein CHLRE_10g429702v5 [Chlamydomonas reinhardtii]